MRIAVEGCTHGELERTYDTLAVIEQRTGKSVDLLICCGDFQSTRCVQDLHCMAVPDKYKDMGTFYKYYSGEKVAPVLTLFIGGNHEASNALQELAYGGWVAPNIYYMGYANVVRVGGIRIGAISGIFKGGDYLKGHYEAPPYDASSIRSAYHLRNLDVFRLRQMRLDPPDIMLSHDWPSQITQWGDVEQLLRFKRHFRDDIERGQLGSRPTQEVLDELKPKYWFSAHLHCKFSALVRHAEEDGGSDEAKVTRFLALDKCLPGRRFLQVLTVDEKTTRDESEDKVLEYDPTWLAVLKSTNHLLSVRPTQTHMPGPGYHDRWDFAPTEEERNEVLRLLDNDVTIPSNFERTVKPYNPAVESVKNLYELRPPVAETNAQTAEFCRRLQIDDPYNLVIKSRRSSEYSQGGNQASIPLEQNTFVSFNEDEIKLDEEDDDENELASETSVAQAEQPETKRSSLVLPPPKHCEIGDVTSDRPQESMVGFVVDTVPGSNEQDPQPGSSSKKVLKRRNVAMYAEQEDD